MKKLLVSIKWDLLLIVKYQILTVALVMAVLYSFVLYILPPFENSREVTVLLIFSDPAMLGFIFIGVMVLFEKSANTLEALIITPMKVWHYIVSKTLSLTLIALPCSFAIAISGFSLNFNSLHLFFGIVLSSLLFVLIGFTGVANVKRFNEYIIKIPLFMAPVCLPVLNYLNITDTVIWYIIPSQASLIILDSAFEKAPLAELLYAYSYLILWIGVAYYVARYQFAKKLFKTS